MARPVLLALSSFRRSQAQIERALTRAADSGAPLIAAFVVDVNLARYFVASDVPPHTSLRRLMEQGILKEHEARGQRVLDEVCARATERGIPCTTVLKVGRYAEEIAALAAAHDVQVIVVTRAARPDWLRRLFGSPVDRLCNEVAGQCEVEIV